TRNPLAVHYKPMKCKPDDTMRGEASVTASRPSARSVSSQGMHSNLQIPMSRGATVRFTESNLHLFHSHGRTKLKGVTSALTRQEMPCATMQAFAPTARNGQTNHNDSVC